MFVNCPNCGSKHVRHSKYQGLGERIGAFFGRHPLRCKDCQHRFVSRVFRIRDAVYARCPRCYRMDLSSWSEEHYSPRWVTLMKMRFGAKRLRCEYCRFNWAGFKPVKERYVSRSARRAQEAVREEQTLPHGD